MVDHAALGLVETKNKYINRNARANSQIHTYVNATSFTLPQQNRHSRRGEDKKDHAKPCNVGQFNVMTGRGGEKEGRHTTQHNNTTAFAKKWKAEQAILSREEESMDLSVIVSYYSKTIQQAFPPPSRLPRFVLSLRLILPC